MRVLFVDDERDLVSSLSRYFRLHGFDTSGAYGVADAVGKLDEARSGRMRYDAVVTDLRMPDGDGLTVLREVRRMLPGTPVLVMTAFGSVATSVEAMRLGAVTMLEKPVPVAQLEREVRDAIAAAREVEGGLEAAGGAGLIGNSPAIRAVFDTLVRVAPSNSTVLIQGESGTGKELIARAIHNSGDRAPKPFVAVSCAALAETLLESELFGHEKGAFTGAAAQRQANSSSPTAAPSFSMRSATSLPNCKSICCASCRIGRSIAWEAATRCGWMCAWSRRLMSTCSRRSPTDAFATICSIV